MTKTFAQRVIAAAPDCPLIAISAQLMTNYRRR